jgi:hypothetical protein
MSVSHLDALLDRLDLPGPPIVITHSVPLSPESLLQVVVDALED